VTWRKWHTWVTLLCLAFLVLLPIVMAEGTIAGWLGLTLGAKYGIWVLILADIFVLMAVAGHGTTGRKAGLLIDERNRMSSSRFQLIIWTLVIIPALLAFFYFNIAHGAPDAANIAIPSELWVLLGISGGAAIGAPIVNDATNRSKKPTEDALRLTIPNAGQLSAEELSQAKTTAKATLEGVLDVNTGVDDASFADIFEGDELGNREHLDISKLQMLIITLGLAVSYAYAILTLLAQTSPPLTSFPPVNSSLALLLAVSQGTYLSYKAAPHTGTKGAD
jgi:hypothetical protein